MLVWLTEPHFDKDRRYCPRGTQIDWGTQPLTENMLPLDAAATTGMNAQFLFKPEGNGRYVRKPGS